MNKASMLPLAVLGLLVSAAVAATPASATPSAPSFSCANLGTWKGSVTTYSVKFTCGQQSSTDDDVVQGIYRTNINIHNPNLGTVNFCSTVVLPNDASPTGSSTPLPLSLGPNQALFIDCFTSEAESIVSQLPSLPPDTTETEGFVVIQIPNSYGPPTLLDVIGKYTARPQFSVTTIPGVSAAAIPPGGVSSLQIVPYSPAVIP